MLEIQEMQLENDNYDPNTQPRCNQDKIELDERYFIGMQEERGAGLQIALQLGSAVAYLPQKFTWKELVNEGWPPECQDKYHFCQKYV